MIKSTFICAKHAKMTPYPPLALNLFVFYNSGRVTFFALLTLTACKLSEKTNKRYLKTDHGQTDHVHTDQRG